MDEALTGWWLRTQKYISQLRWTVLPSTFVYSRKSTGKARATCQATCCHWYTTFFHRHQAQDLSSHNPSHLVGSGPSLFFKRYPKFRIYLKMMILVVVQTFLRQVVGLIHAFGAVFRAHGNSYSSWQFISITRQDQWISFDTTRKGWLIMCVFRVLWKSIRPLSD